MTLPASCDNASPQRPDPKLHTCPTNIALTITLTPICILTLHLKHTPTLPPMVTCDAYQCIEVICVDNLLVKPHVEAARVVMW